MASPAASTAALPDTRERILAVAQVRFTEKGYEATSLREIAEDLGITKAALYYHFPSKSDLLRAMLTPIGIAFDELAAELEAVRTSDRPVEQWAIALEGIIGNLTTYWPLFALVQRNRQVVEAVFAESNELFQFHEDGHSRIDELVMAVDVPLRDRVRMVCSLVAITGFDDWAPGLLATLDHETFVREMVAMTRDVLGLPPKA